ncbi:DNA alkylation repair protein [Ilumatobacter nonamiensis]|uniref:DNA alkylation repair protein n=1 Tax=Ilumatobacter nonamiensis TaxID=467093 RepID=UPI0003488581|nr:DNA alkylation repair protein [Ilumatobacter nonamiensis]
MDTAPDAVDGLRDRLAAVAVPADATPMAAYMKGRFPFLGVKTPARRLASRPLINASKRADIDGVVDTAYRLRSQPEREFHYVASDLLAANARRLAVDHLDDLRHFITTDSWWDTVDALASPTVGTMVLAHPGLVDALDEWIDDPDFWLARTAIIHQLRFQERTDVDRLFRYSLRRAGDPEFFIRKAIGWALRQYARIDPGAVRTFIDAHVEDLSPLTVREASKHL